MLDSETGGLGNGARRQIKSFRDLRVWQNAVNAAMEIYHVSKRFPPEERYSLTDQIRRSSRSVAANIAEAWRKRRYRAAFVSKLSGAESEACETQTWIKFALRCELPEAVQATTLDSAYEQVMAQLVTMINLADRWTVTSGGNV